jgi:uncharacterized protein YcbK (DUF882 family)
VISRRSFLKAAVAASVILPFRPMKAFAAQKAERSLNLYNTHTGENLDISYYSAGRYDYEAIGQINYLLRCHFTNEVKAMDLRVLDLLSDIKDLIGKDKQLRIISGYRSPQYNEHLFNIGRGVVRDSLHLRGLAIDFAVEGFGTNRIAGVAKSFAAGGVGKYSEFVHIDVGRVRYWG